MCGRILKKCGVRLRTAISRELEQLSDYRLLKKEYWSRVGDGAGVDTNVSTWCSETLAVGKGAEHTAVWAHLERVGVVADLVSTHQLWLVSAEPWCHVESDITWLCDFNLRCCIHYFRVGYDFVWNSSYQLCINMFVSCSIDLMCNLWCH
jgi:hypothetical protein